MYAGLDALEDRTRQFTIDVTRFCGTLPRTPGLSNIAHQLAAAAGSVGANHRAMRRARSRREFAAKLQTVVEEADESVFWLEVLADLSPHTDDGPRLLDEAQQLRAIFVKARSTNRRRQ